jgi:2',3'-cyclic-nucleotide 2'-phosphodiesterase (5'-nucleotidase family)
MLKFLFILFVTLSSAAHARLVQIIHTNDLHSYFAGTRGGMGGYARLKTVIDELRERAASQGMISIYVDGGDFGEGSSYYFSHQGVDSLRALDLLGVDVTVLGNHDFILGGRELANQIKEAKLSASILSANMGNKRMTGLLNYLPDSVDVQVGEFKVRIFGLTTPDLHFQYPLRPLGFILPPHKIGLKVAEKAKKDKVDYLIALTHQGLNRDTKLVQKSRSIDLVVGGHDHIRLEEPKLIKNLEGREIPILQAGAHGTAVGSLILDLQRDGQTKVIDYRIYDVTMDIQEDQKIKKFVDTAYSNREQYFKRSWEEVIGFSHITLNGNYNGVDQNQKSCWSEHMAKLTRVSAKADLGFQIDNFQGEEIAPGPIRYGDMIDNFPHFRKWGDEGWQIVTAYVPGFLLKWVIQFLNSPDSPLPLTIDGFNVKRDGQMESYQPGKHRGEKIYVGQYPIRNFKLYKVALPGELTFGVLRTSSFLANLVFLNHRPVKNGHYWPLLEKYIRENSPLSCNQLY